MTFLPTLASGSVAGKPILVAATSSPGTTLHTATAETDAAGLDEIWIWAANNHSAAVSLTFQFGDTANKDSIEQSVPSKAGTFLLIPGMRLNAGAIVKAYATTADVISCVVSVNRYVA